MIRILALFALSLGLAACDMYAPDTVTEHRVQVREEKFTEQVPVRDIKGDYIAAMSQRYMRNGQGPVNLTITYDPVSRSNTAMHASDEAVRISRAFREEGVSNVVTSVLPVREQGSESLAILSFSSYMAAAPIGCGQMPGYATTDVDHDPNYKIGCTMEGVFAQQIANPADLLGNVTASPTSDGRVSTNVVEAYRKGEPNKPLEGEVASE